MEHDVRRLFGERPLKSLEVADVELAGREARALGLLRLEARGAVALERDVVVAAEVVDSGDFPSPAQELARRVESDETGGTSD